MPQVLTQALLSIKSLSRQVRMGLVNEKEVNEKMKEIQDRIGKDLKQGEKKEEPKKEKKDSKITEPK